MTEIRMGYAGAAAELLFRCMDKEVLIEGPAGTGKTQACLAKCVLACESFQNCRVLIARSTRVSMTETVLVTLEREFLIESHRARWGSDATRANRRNYVWPDTKSEIIVAGLDNTMRIMSAEYDLIYVAEATEINEEDWERLLTRLRNKGELGYHQAVADCNPSSPGHWLNRRANEGKMVRLKSRHEDNPSVTPDYLGTLKNLTGHRRARLYEGRWVAAEGSVFPEFDRSKHVVDPFDIPDTWPQIVLCDPGYDHPCAILFVAISPTGRWFICKEIYGPGMSVPAAAGKLIDAMPGRLVVNKLMDPRHGWRKTMESPRPIVAQFADHGLQFGRLPALAGATKDAGVEAYRSKLVKGMVRVFSTCVNTIDEHESWRYKRNAKGEQLEGDEKFEDRDNHALDCLIGLSSMHVDVSRRYTTDAVEQGAVRVIG